MPKGESPMSFSPTDKVEVKRKAPSSISPKVIMPRKRDVKKNVTPMKPNRDAQRFWT